jgi:DNA-binding transcriptional LysR family regulator
MTQAHAPDLNRVGIFLKVVDEGGFTKAAKALGLPKSSVSRSVALLEQELRARLLRRSSRSVAPTEAGLAFYEKASRGMALLGEAREAVSELDAELRGPIRITAAAALAVWRLAPVVAEFVDRHSGVLVDVLLTGRTVDLLDDGVDFALHVGQVRDENLVARKLPGAEFALYAAPAYLDQHGAPRRVADLASHRCVLFKGVRGRATWTLRSATGAAESVEVHGSVNIDDFSFATQTVISGAGIGLLPVFVAEAAGGERLSRVLPRHHMSGSPMHLVYRAERYMPRRCAVFRDFLLERTANWPSLELR